MVVTEMKREYVRDFLRNNGDNESVMVVTTELGDVPVSAIVRRLSEINADMGAYALASTATLLSQREKHIVLVSEERNALKRKVKRLKKKLRKWKVATK